MIDAGHPVAAPVNNAELDHQASAFQPEHAELAAGDLLGKREHRDQRHAGADGDDLFYELRVIRFRDDLGIARRPKKNLVGNVSRAAAALEKHEGIGRYFVNARRCFAGEDVPPLYYSEQDPDGDLVVDSETSLAESIAAWRREIELSEGVLDRAGDLGELSAAPRHGHHPNMRWILVHLIEEYARHSGHADLLRERIDGVVGD